jgi:predicted RNA methylase
VGYDLGCGDGRIVITAMRDFGARGACVDIDPVRIAESRENARQANVVEDLFATERWRRNGGDALSLARVEPQDAHESD